MIRYFKNNLENKEIIQIPEFQKNCWIHVESPTSDEKDYLIEELGVPLAFLNDLEDIDERPRIDDEEDWMFIIIRVPLKNLDADLPYATAPLGLIFKEDIFISLINVHTEVIDDFILYSKRKHKVYTNYYDLVLRLILSSSVWFLKYLKQIDQLIKSAENSLQLSIRNEELETLLRIEKCLVYFTTSLRGNEILLNKIKNNTKNTNLIDLELLEDVEIELKQAQEITGIFSDILSGMMDAYASVISNNLNIVMKRLTSISIILMIPTLISSFFGMNLKNYLEENKFAFLGVVLLSFVITYITMIYFKRKNWF